MLKIVPLDEGGEDYRAPDLVWDGHAGDFAVNTLDHPTAPGDLRAEQGLATQVFICLMTDRRVEDHELSDGEANRGWVGDTFDNGPHETPIGSKLWLLRRSGLFEGIETQAETYAREALQTLIDQGAAVRVEASAIADRATNRLDLTVTLTGRDGGQAYQQTFEILWRQIDGVATPLAR